MFVYFTLSLSESNPKNFIYHFFFFLSLLWSYATNSCIFILIIMRHNQSKRDWLNGLIAHFNPFLTITCADQGVRNVRFSENLACFVFLEPLILISFPLINLIFHFAILPTKIIPLSLRLLNRRESWETLENRRGVG